MLFFYIEDKHLYISGSDICIIRDYIVWWFIDKRRLEIGKVKLNWNFVFLENEVIKDKN